MMRKMLKVWWLLASVNVMLVSMVTCQETEIVFTQAEEQSEGEFVGSVSTSPNILSMVGEEDRPELRYSVLGEGFPFSDHFQIDTDSGNITFARRVDRETVCPFTDDCHVDFDVAVSRTNFFSTVHVKVMITDINDNRPMFDPSTTNVRFSESVNVGFSTLLPTATDADKSERFSVNAYAIEPESSVFGVVLTQNRVGTPQVNLVLKEALDREKVHSYTLRVVARDGGSPPFTGELLVNVTVEDFNDNAPEFSKTFYAANFSENAGEGYEIIRVLAKDRDEGDNGRVTYMLSSLQPSGADMQDKIKVNSVTGAVVLRQSLTSGEYRILIDAHDSGNPRKSNQAVVMATVLDTENNEPTVLVNPVRVGDLPVGWVAEGAEVSTVVAVLTVDDPDSGKNGNVTCESSGPFFQLQQLQAGSYKVMVARTLNREDVPVHVVTVTCQDQGTPSLNATARFTVQVYDENDNSPKFTSPAYVQNLVENNEPGDTVLVVNAVDIDSGVNAEIEYRVANTGGNFTITPSSGIIKANIAFDREVKAEYSFSVLAVDRGNPRKTGVAKITVNIIDTNDEVPRFSQPAYTLYLYENRDVDSAVGNVSVFDPDLNDGGAISLSLRPLNGEEDVPFSVSPDGKIFSTDKFDREDKDVYNFFVLAEDNGQRPLSSTAEIEVQIQDENDNRPTFVFPSEHNFSAFVNIPIEREDVILQVDVFDDDINKNGIITYNIISTNGSDLFRIGKFSGDVIARRDLETQEMGTYAITINASDQGSPRLWQARTLILVVQSESAKSDSVIADQNVLIVACIICFTVIVCGAVLVALCVLRRLDRQKKLHYATTCCPQPRADSEAGSVGGHPQQYDLAGPSLKDPTMKLDSKKSPYHQQRQQQQQPPPPQTPSAPPSSQTGPTTQRGSSSRNLPSSSVCLGPAAQGTNTFFPTSRQQAPECSVPVRHEDFHSTSSTETAAGDSGHGSDEDLSNSLEHNSTPSVVMNSSLTLPLGKDRHRSPSPLEQMTGGRGTQSHHRVQRPSAVKSPQRGKQSVVRFDPHVTDIYDKGDNPARRPRSEPKPHQSVPGAHQNNTGSAGTRIHNPTLPAPTFAPAKSTRTYMPSKPQSSSASQPHHSSRPSSTPQHLELTSAGKQAIHLPRLPPQRQLSGFSQSSLGDPEDSDMNTTTSGSYSVASDDVARLNSLADLKDLYV